ncbi:hypothetical protein CHS0354_000007 [Potamilus streckersoni]|uniref:Uncharacterized protein n=1 Tax=Potamilus streckersoni TaxID=2493646 RepID=A0AAE0T1D7_9BIVA|nr:hypothetical protein CHS0354_000007 [Potamilus streckersoni]
MQNPVFNCVVLPGCCKSVAAMKRLTICLPPSPVSQPTPWASSFCIVSCDFPNEDGPSFPYLLATRQSAFTRQWRQTLPGDKVTKCVSTLLYNIAIEDESSHCRIAKVFAEPGVDVKVAVGCYNHINNSANTCWSEITLPELGA